MFRLNYFSNIGFLIYLIFYLIIPNSAITQTKIIDLSKNIENALNSRDIKFINKKFRDKENLKITKKFSKIIEEFPDSKWEIKKLKSNNPYEEIFRIKVLGTKIIGKEKYYLESNFNYLLSIENSKIVRDSIKNLLTTIRNDNNKIDISFNIPNKVFTGTKYDIDIILNEPLGEVIIAGGIKQHQEELFLREDIVIEPLVSGGIFKVARASKNPGRQIWSGIIAHPEGMITFTKSIDIVEKI